MADTDRPWPDTPKPLEGEQPMTETTSDQISPETAGALYESRDGEQVDGWTRVTEVAGWLLNPDDLDESYTDGATVQIVRRSAAPGAREDGETDRLPGTYLSADHLVTFDDFDEPGDIWARWAQAQAMVAGLNGAAAAVVEKVTR